jgi:hypothetical protein
MKAFTDAELQDVNVSLFTAYQKASKIGMTTVALKISQARAPVLKEMQEREERRIKERQNGTE